jgi:FixJ family two-component response regulator
LGQGPLDMSGKRSDHPGMAETPRLIAIVDDDPHVRSALNSLFRSSGFASKEFGSVRDFLVSLSGGLPDCIIVDLQMPGMTWLELQQELRGQDIRLPFIIMTGHFDPELRKECEAAGAIAFLTKPPEEAALFAAIDAACGIKGSCLSDGARRP